MRRSNAPSKVGEKFNAPLNCITSTEGRHKTDSLAVPVTIENAARSTKSILGLIAKCKQSSDIGDMRESEVAEPLKEIAVLNKDETTHHSAETPTNIKRLFNVVYGKPSKKKHKTWEGDGVLEIGEKSLTLKDSEGNIIGRGSGKKNSELNEGSRLFVGNKEVEIIDLVPESKMVSTKRPIESESSSPQHPTMKKLKVSGSLKRLTSTPLSHAYTPLTMPQPDLEHQWQFNKSGAPVSIVSIDPNLARVLRPHQREGVTFLYRCVTGLRNSRFFGAILADEMGLGKTLQTITLIWTLLRQGLYGNAPLFKKVLIVAPSSLCRNWHQEFLHWLGKFRIDIFLVDQKNKPKDFVKQSKASVMIISYEMFVRCYEDVSCISFDLVVCDEGHRLKNNSIKVSTLLSQLPCQRRVLLTGTPIQNDLQEFYTLINFVNPNILGIYPEFRKTYEESIVKSRQQGVPDDVKAEGERKAKELTCQTAGFVLRRTHAILNKYLPSKHELVVFCRPSPLQVKLFQSAISCWGAEDQDREVSHLAVITALKKISSHPILLRDSDEDKENDYLSDYLCAELSRLTNDKIVIEDASKLAVVTALLQSISETTEKIVLVSYFTQTLDLLEAICDQFGYKHCRLDGSTPSSKRVDIVNEFNSQYSSRKIFLLSARAGGVGLNLIGASKLVLFDPDWNPASDMQAMARIWRDGQQKTVYIYRLLTTGSIEEKIFQRQLSKAGLSEAVVDPTNSSAVRLSHEELKDLFTVDEDIDCVTHRMLPCDCEGNGNIPKPLVPLIDTRQCQLLAKAHGQSLRSNQLYQWEHYRQPISPDLLEAVGLSEAGQFITFVFRNVVETTPDTSSH